MLRMKYSKLYILIISFTFFAACKKEHDEVPQVPVPNTTSADTLGSSSGYEKRIAHYNYTFTDSTMSYDGRDTATGLIKQFVVHTSINHKITLHIDSQINKAYFTPNDTFTLANTTYTKFLLNGWSYYYQFYAYQILTLNADTIVLEQSLQGTYGNYRHANTLRGIRNN